MSKRESAKYKIDRRLGENIWGRPKSPVNKREYGPGQHGQRRKGKLSDFGLQLRAKQKLKGHYGDVSEKQFRKAYEEANRRSGDTSENLIGLLESRLDAVVYRAKFVPTIFAARQFVNHGHINVNGKRVNIGSYRCKAGDVIEVREKSKQLVIVLESVQPRRARRAGLHRGRPQQDDRHLRPRSRAGRMFRSPCRWNRTWSSNSIRADRSIIATSSQAAFEAAFSFGRSENRFRFSGRCANSEQQQGPLCGRRAMNMLPEDNSNAIRS